MAVRVRRLLVQGERVEVATYEETTAAEGGTHIAAVYSNYSKGERLGPTAMRRLFGTDATPASVAEVVRANGALVEDATYRKARREQYERRRDAVQRFCARDVIHRFAGVPPEDDEFNPAFAAAWARVAGAHEQLAVPQQQWLDAIVEAPNGVSLLGVCAARAMCAADELLIRQHEAYDVAVGGGDGVEPAAFMRVVEPFARGGTALVVSRGGGSGDAEGGSVEPSQTETGTAWRVIVARDAAPDLLRAAARTFEDTAIAVEWLKTKIVGCQHAVGEEAVNRYSRAVEGSRVDVALLEAVLRDRSTVPDAGGTGGPAADAGGDGGQRDASLEAAAREQHVGPSGDSSARRHPGGSKCAAPSRQAPRAGSCEGVVAGLAGKTLKQLVELCRQHKLRTNGRKEDLVDRLTLHLNTKQPVRRTEKGRASNLYDSSSDD